MEQCFVLDFLSVNRYPLIMVFWNLFLLIIPFFLADLLKQYYIKTKFKELVSKLVAFLLFFLWLLFIPNTAYVITDVRHLLDYCPRAAYNAHICPENAWMIMFFFIYALFGWIFLVYLLRQMKNLINKVFKNKFGEYFIIIVIPLISIGLLIGLIQRFNSWDFFIRPLAIFESMLKYVTSFIYFKNLLVFTIGLYILYYGGDFLFKKKLRINKKSKN